MRWYLLIVGLLLMMVCGTGCVVIDVEKVQSCHAGPAEPRAAMDHQTDDIGRSGFDHGDL